MHVTYSDPGIDIGNIDAAMQVVGTFTDPLEVLSVSTDAAAGTTPNVVHTPIASPAQRILDVRQRIYHVNVVQDAVNDTPLTPASCRLGSFRVLVGVKLQVTINLSPIDGLAQTFSFWIGFHDGNFSRSDRRRRRPVYWD
ncbi:hypothetical protein [Rosistilla oblonga]|uniref:hypothetical protein n=1 Tax=Rosistilla oblonga TaxID=2527990 RepID=UPI003A96A4D5